MSPSIGCTGRTETHTEGMAFLFIRSDIPSRNVKDIEHANIESLAIEYTVNKTKWVLHAVYRPHRRTGQHPFGGGGRPSFARMDSVGGGVVAEIFRDPYSVGGGPGSIFCGMADFFPLTAVTDPKFVLFKHVLCFARIMSTLCPNSCQHNAYDRPPSGNATRFRDYMSIILDISLTRGTTYCWRGT